MEDAIADGAQRGVAVLVAVGNGITEAQRAENERDGNDDKDKPPQPVGREAEPWPRYRTALLRYQHIFTIP